MNPSCQELETVLRSLLEPNSLVINQATKNITALLKAPNGVANLITITMHSSYWEIRQSAAVYLRKKLDKFKSWKKYDRRIQNEMKIAILNASLTESHETVANSLAEVVGSLANHETKQKNSLILETIWPHLNNPQQLERALLILEKISNYIGSKLKPQLLFILNLFSHTLMDCQNSRILIHSIRIMRAILPSIGSDEKQLFQSLIPKLLEAIKFISIENPKEPNCFEICVDLMSHDLNLIQPFYKDIILLFIEVGSNSKYNRDIRVNAIHQISWFISCKKSVILKNELVRFIIEAMFSVLCSPDANTEDYYDKDDNCLSNSITMIFENMAFSLNDQVFVPDLMHFMELSIQKNIPFALLSCLKIIASILEGCTIAFSTKYLDFIMGLIIEGINSPDPQIILDALITLSTAASFLDESLVQYVPLLIPPVLNILKNSQPNASMLNQLISKNCIEAIEALCSIENIDIKPVIAPVMEALLQHLNNPTTTEVLRLKVLEAISSVATSSKKDFSPFFNDLYQQFMEILQQMPIDKDVSIKTGISKTLSKIMQTLAKEIPHNLVQNTLVICLELLKQTNELAFQQGLFHIFGAVGAILQSEIRPYLHSIMLVLSSIFQTFIHEENIFNPEIENFDDSSEDLDEVSLDEESEEEQEEHIKGGIPRTTKIIELMDTLEVLSFLISSIGEEIGPFYSQLYEGLQALLTIEDEALQAVVLTTQLSLLKTSSATPENLESYMQNLLVTIKLEASYDLVEQSIECLVDLLKSKKLQFLNDSHLEEILNIIKLALQWKLPAIQEIDEDCLESDGSENEEDLVGSCLELLPSLGQQLNLSNFYSFFTKLFEDIKTLPMIHKSICSDKMLILGSLAESLSIIGESSPDLLNQFTPQIYPIFLKGTKAQFTDVRNNAVYGIGILVYYNAQNMIVYFPDILAILSDLWAKEKNSMTLDNMCSTVAKMILVHKEAVPLAQVIPVLLSSLPIKCDLEENNYIFRCLTELYSSRNELIISNLIQVLAISYQSSIKDPSLDLSVSLLKTINSEYPQEFQKFAQSLDSSDFQNLKNIFETGS